MIDILEYVLCDVGNRKDLFTCLRIRIGLSVVLVISEFFMV